MKGLITKRTIKRYTTKRPVKKVWCKHIKWNCHIWESVLKLKNFESVLFPLEYMHLWNYCPICGKERPK